MKTEPEEWKLRGFLRHFRTINGKQSDQAFAWVLGAGASQESGIPTGGELVAQWLAELHEQQCDDGTPVESWATGATLGIEGFDYAEAATFYSRVFERRYGGYADEAYGFLEHVMSDKDPSPGYSILAKILEDTRHKVVVTTNFDNLVADALSIYTRVFPLVCGHESLTHFVRPQLRRPLVCKIHRDLLLAPQNDPSSLQRLNEAWTKTLNTLFSHYTPLVIGYGGNDDTFMGLLEALEPGQIKGRMLWCYYANWPPRQRIRDAVRRHRGVLVAVPTFDRLMVLLGEQLGIKPQDQVIELRAAARATAYRKRMEELRIAVTPGVPPATEDPSAAAVAAALESTLDKAEGWWAWQLKADRESDLDKREQIYREAVRALPNSAELRGNFAAFLHTVRRKYDEAEELYRGALELAPNDADYTGNFAIFMDDIRREHNEAERLYRRALELDGKHPDNICNFAVFLHAIRQSYDEAEQLYREAVKLAPNEPRCIGALAVFTHMVRRDYDEAERLYRRALELDPRHGRNTSNLASFLQDARRDYSEAERLHRSAVVLDPNDAESVGSLASFLHAVRHYDDEAEQLYWRAIALDPNNATSAANLVGLLLEHERWEDAAGVVRTAWKLTQRRSDQVAAEVSLYRGLIERSRDSSDERSLGRLKALLKRDFPRAEWSFDNVLVALRPRLSDDDFGLYSALAASILDTSMQPQLDRFSRWHEIATLSLDAAWE